jgi:hypothetical protein
MLSMNDQRPAKIEIPEVYFMQQRLTVIEPAKVFPTEVDLLARNSGMRLKATEEFLTGRLPSASTWGVAYLLQR